MKKYLIFTILTLLLMGCDDDSSGTPEGSEGGPCYGNGSCDTGLVCVEDICVPEGTNNANPGELNGPCLTGDVCNEKLVCDNQICKTDNDEDGYHVGNDCDDNDAMVYPGTIHDCQSECAYGTMSCNSQGVYTECTADTECTCPQAGDTREVECGKCGTATVMCTADLVWEFPTECENEGECYPWETGTQECGFCGHQERSCTAACAWESWNECSDQGECSPGTTEWTTDDCTPLGFVQQRECDDTCNWNALVECFGDCVGEARQDTVDISGNSDFKAEACIPAGAFIMGNDADDLDDAPERIVYLSPYYIDIYEVSNGRYKECVDAGVCNEPSEFELYPHDDPEYADMPVAHVTREDALTFCNWDGGRTLPSEAQWEKAAKGPHPEQKIWPWGNSPEISCDLVSATTCPDNTTGNVYQVVDSHPLTVSYFGLHHTLGNVGEICIDNYSFDEGNDLVGIDPVHTVPQNDYYSVKGPDSYIWISERFLNINYRGFIQGDNSSTSLGFRCARRAY